MPAIRIAFGAQQGTSLTSLSLVQTLSDLGLSVRLTGDGIVAFDQESADAAVRLALSQRMYPRILPESDAPLFYCSDQRNGTLLNEKGYSNGNGAWGEITPMQAKLRTREEWTVIMRNSWGNESYRTNAKLITVEEADDAWRNKTGQKAERKEPA